MASTESIDDNTITANAALEALRELLKAKVNAAEAAKPITDVRALLGEAQFQERFVTADYAETLPVRACGGAEWL